jgi:hypothetical protein
MLIMYMHISIELTHIIELMSLQRIAITILQHIIDIIYSYVRVTLLSLTDLIIHIILIM